MDQFPRELGAALEEATMQVESESGGEDDRNFDAEANRCKRRSRRAAPSRNLRGATHSFTPAQLSGHLIASQFRSDSARGRLRAQLDSAQMRSQQNSGQFHSRTQFSSSKFGASKFRSALMSDDSDSSQLESSMCHSLSEQTALGGSSSVEYGHGRSGRADDSDSVSSDEPTRSAFAATHFLAKRFRKRPSSAHRRKLDCYYMPTVNRVQSNVQKHRMNAKTNSASPFASSCIVRQPVSFGEKVSPEPDPANASTLADTGPASSKPQIPLEINLSDQNIAAPMATQNQNDGEAANCDWHRYSTATIVESSEWENRLVDESDSKRLLSDSGTIVQMELSAKDLPGELMVDTQLGSRINSSSMDDAQLMTQTAGASYSSPMLPSNIDSPRTPMVSPKVANLACACSSKSANVTTASCGHSPKCAASASHLSPIPASAATTITADGSASAVPNLGFSLDPVRTATGNAARGRLRSIVEERSLRTRKRRKRTRFGRRAASTDDDHDVGESSLSESSGENGLWSSVHRSGDDRDADDEQEQSDFWYAEPDANGHRRLSGSSGNCGATSDSHGDLQLQSRAMCVSEASKPDAGLLLFNVGVQNLLANRLFKTGRRCYTHDVPKLTRTSCPQPTCTSPSATAPRSIFDTQLCQFENQLRTNTLVNMNLVVAGTTAVGVQPRHAHLRSHSSAGLTSQSSVEHVDSASKRRKNEDGIEPGYHHDTSSNADNSPSPSHLVVRTSMEI